jgi:hypothetical protein
MLFFQTTSNGNYKPDLVFDGANGVGADKMASFARNLQNFLNITILNDGKNPVRMLFLLLWFVKNPIHIRPNSKDFYKFDRTMA